MVSVSTYAGFLISGLVIISIFSAVADVFFRAEIPAEARLATKSIPFDFSVSKLPESKEVKLPDTVLINGLLFGSNALSYNLSLPNGTETVSLSFDVARTNRYAPLDIRADGFAESRKLPKGSYSYDLGIGRNDGNMLLKIQPESSWWRIWAPALYDLRNAKLMLNAFKSESQSFQFSTELPVESASLVLQFDKRAGTFMADLNDRTVFRGTVSGVQTIPINTTLFVKENSIVFAAANNSQFSGTGTLVINYNVQQEVG